MKIVPYQILDAMYPPDHDAPVVGQILELAAEIYVHTETGRRLPQTQLCRFVEEHDECFVAKVGQRVFGFAGVSYCLPDQGRENYVWLEALVVAPDSRAQNLSGQGPRIGSALLERVIQAAQALDVGRIALEAGLESGPFYAKNSFREATSEEVSQYPVSNPELPVMIYDLPKQPQM